MPLTERKFDVFEFMSSLGLIGYLVIGVLGLAIWNLRKLWKLRTPLDSPQHKAWRRNGGLIIPIILTLQTSPRATARLYGGLRLDRPFRAE